RVPFSQYCSAEKKSSRDFGGVQAAAPWPHRSGLKGGFPGSCGRGSGGLWGTLSLIPQLDPRRSVVARFLPATDIAIDARLLQPAGERGIEQQVIDSKPGITLIGVTEVIPERKDLRVRVQRANRIRPSLPQDLRVGLTDLDPEE